MDEINKELVLPGTIWSVKSYNEYDEDYLGMTYGQHEVLILNSNLKNNTISYIKLGRSKKHSKVVALSNLNSSKLYDMKMSGIYVGDINCLNELIDAIPAGNVSAICDLIVKSFLPTNTCKETVDKQNQKLREILYIKRPLTVEELDTLDDFLKTTDKTENKQVKLFKYGIDVYITPNKDANIDCNNKIILSDVAKDDFIYHGTTKEDRLKLCEKYLIYPEKAIREIRNRLVYRHKQKEG